MKIYKNNFFYLTLIFWIGFSSLVYEIYSTRVLFLFFSQTSWAITIAISAFLAGLAFSSLFFSRLAKTSSQHNLLIIWVMQLFVATYAFFILRDYNLIPGLIDQMLQHGIAPSLIGAVKITIMWIYLFIPAFFIGGSFPLVSGLVLRSKETGTVDTGLVYFWDTCGSILGALVTGFFLLPFLGFHSTVTIGVLINLVIAVVIAPNWRLRLAVVVGSIAVAICMALIVHKQSFSNALPSNSTPNKLGEFSSLATRFGDILFQQQSQYGLITVGNNIFGTLNNKGLFINFRNMCAVGGKATYTDPEDPQAVLGDLTVAKLSAHSHVLNIGLGCGFTADTIASSSQVDHLDIAEINPVVVKVADKYFSKENKDVLHSPKTTLLVEDGAELLRTSKQTYDAIIIDIEEPTIIDSSPLYTREYYALAHKLLKPKGILSVWAHNGPPDYGKVFYNTLTAEFPDVQMRVVGLNGYFLFYASEAHYDFRVTNHDEQTHINDVLNNPSTEINTLDNRVLEKYFNLSSFQDLPTDYNDPFIDKLSK